LQFVPEGVTNFYTCLLPVVQTAHCQLLSTSNQPTTEHTCILQP